MNRRIDRPRSQLQACLSLLEYIEEADDDRKKGLMITDCVARAESLPPEARTAIERRIAESYRPVETRLALKGAALAIPMEGRKHIDVLITTVVPVEERAARIAFDLIPDNYVTHDGRRYYETIVDCRQRGDHPLAVVVTTIGRANNTKASSAVGQMLQRYVADAYFLAGIAAGLEGSVELGDVVIPVQATYFESGTATRKKFEPRPDPKVVPDPLGLNLGYYDPAATSYYKKLAKALPRVPEDATSPETGDYRPSFPDKVVIACGDKVRRDGSLKYLNDRYDSRIKAGDMESYGFADALPRSQWGVFRGISDYGELDKEDPWQMYAALAACLALRDFLETEFEPPGVPRY